jgi:hypothetical protein
MEVIGQSTDGKSLSSADGKNRSKHRWKKFVKCRWKELVKASMERIYQSVEPRENLMGVDAIGICSSKTKEELGD